MTSANPAPSTSTLGPVDADSGLLTPVRVGSAVEAATGDTAYLQAMLDAEAALTQAQADLGLAPAVAAATVRAAADAAQYDVADLARRARAGGNPIIPLVADLTAAVARLDPAAAAAVHRGATSQDILDTATMLVAYRALGHLLDDLRRTAAALTRLAAEHRDTVLAGRTLTQHAVPTTFGLKAAGWRSLVLDAYDRVETVRRSLPVQLGGAAGTLAAFVAYARLDRAGAADDSTDATNLIRRYAAVTGLAEPLLPWHTLRTPIADLAGALAVTTGALGKIAVDMLALSRTELGEVTEGAGGGSSAMPQKSNPVRATVIAAAARQVPSLAAILYGALAAEDERPAGAWHAEWQPLRDALRLAGGAARDAAELAEGVRVHPDRMRVNIEATGGLIVAERLAIVLTPLLGRGAARELLTRVCADAGDGRGLAAALAAEPALDGLLDAAALHDLTDPARYLGAAPALTDRALHRRPVPGERP